MLSEAAGPQEIETAEADLRSHSDSMHRDKLAAHLPGSHEASHVPVNLLSKLNNKQAMDSSGFCTDGMFVQLHHLLWTTCQRDSVVSCEAVRLLYRDEPSSSC